MIETTHLVIGSTIETSLPCGQIVCIAMGIESETTAAQTPDKLYPHRQQLSPRQRASVANVYPFVVQ